MHANPFHKSSFRPQMLLGAERKPMLLLMMTSGGLVLTSYNIVAISLAIVLWLVFHPLLVWMGHTDPNLIGIYFRNLKYPRYIPAFTSPFRTAIGYRIPAENKSWKVWSR